MGSLRLVIITSTGLYKWQREIQFGPNPSSQCVFFLSKSVEEIIIILHHNLFAVLVGNVFFLIGHFLGLPCLRHISALK